MKASEVKDGKCPICGKPIKVHEAKPISDVDLVEATRERKARIKQIIQDQVMTNIVDKPVSELKSLSELQAYARLHGYKPGWAWYQAKRKGLIRK